MAEKKSYAGKIKNMGSQIVEPLYPVQKGKSGTVKKGGDLRIKGGN